MKRLSAKNAKFRYCSADSKTGSKTLARKTPTLFESGDFRPKTDFSIWKPKPKNRRVLKHLKRIKCRNLKLLSTLLIEKLGLFQYKFIRLTCLISIYMHLCWISTLIHCRMPMKSCDFCPRVHGINHARTQTYAQASTETFNLLMTSILSKFEW